MDKRPSWKWGGGFASQVMASITAMALWYACAWILSGLARLPSAWLDWTTASNVVSSIAIGICVFAILRLRNALRKEREARQAAGKLSESRAPLEISVHHEHKPLFIDWKQFTGDEMMELAFTNSTIAWLLIKNASPANIDHLVTEIMIDGIRDREIGAWHGLEPRRKIERSDDGIRIVAGAERALALGVVFESVDTWFAITPRMEMKEYQRLSRAPTYGTAIETNPARIDVRFMSEGVSQSVAVELSLRDGMPKVRQLDG